MSESKLELHHIAWLLFSVMIVALCGIAYELIIAAVSSYLLGNSVTQFSITIGLFMFAMGIGSYLTKFIHDRLLERFILIEILVALVGGLSATILFVVFPYYALYKPVMYCLILTIGTLVGLEIPILTRLLSRAHSLSESLAHVLSLDYVGALLGSILFPLLLLPSLGLFRSSYAIGLLNISIAGMALWLFRRQAPSTRRYVPVFVCVVGVLIGALFYSTQITAFAEGRLFADEIIYRSQTPYQRIVISKHPRTDELRLYLDGHLQFASRDEHRYHEALVHPVMSLPGSVRKVLVLGGGDGMAVREILKFPGVESIELVDIDPEMTRLSREFAPIARLNQNSLEDPKVRVIHTDAFNYVQTQYKPLSVSGDFYDRIIIDLPDPHNEALSKLYSKEFYGLLRRCLRPEGALVSQSASPWVTREVFWSIGKSMAAADLKVCSYQAFLNSFGLWGFQMASIGDEATAPVQLAEVPRRYLTNELFVASKVFALDTDHLDVPVNTLFEPKIYSLYEMGLNR